MQYSNLAPLMVVTYTKDYIIEFVRHQTGWTDRNEVSEKRQLQYLSGYLEDKSIDCQTIVAEQEYIDRHFLEDYAEYYARCFPSHPRKCSRLHFFGEKFTEQEFTKGISDENSKKFVSRLQNSYLGFAVIRPIPHTFFAKLCLKPYEKVISKAGGKILQEKITVSLFGVPLTVNTIPFIEQDKVVSACATSALWTALSASKEIAMVNLPSPSAITKSASNALNDGTRTFPTSGMTPPQVSRSLRYFGLEPTITTFDNKTELVALKEKLYAYISGEAPVILGGDVYEEVKGAPLKLLGKHLICVVGYSTRPFTNTSAVKIAAHEIDKFYVHDDRFGPYMKIDALYVEIKVKSKKLRGLKLALGSAPANYIVPDVAIIGLNHKVRIPYEHIFGICQTIRAYLKFALDDAKRIIKKIEKTPVSDINDYKFYAKLLTQATQGTWDITLTTSAQIKFEIRESKNFFSFNSSGHKTALLLKSLPKHVWRCRIATVTKSSRRPFTDILFDATEVPQGRVVIGYITYDGNAQALWTFIEKNVKDRVFQTYETGIDGAKAYIGCVFKFFAESGEEMYLNTLYGHLGVPRRPLKDGETDAKQNITARTDVRTIRRGNPITKTDYLDRDTKYVYVINDAGDLVLGEDIHEGDEYQGHPTLIDGKPGRIAGELFFNAIKSKWQANLKSRTYSAHIDRHSDEALRYVDYLIQNNLQGLDCEIDKIYHMDGKAH